MPRFVGRGSSRLALIALAAILLFGFSPISRGLLRSVDGNFGPTPYSALSLRDPSADFASVLAGQSIRVVLTNGTAHAKTYHWTAFEKGSLISLGEETVASGRSVMFSVPTSGAHDGTLRIVLNGTRVFLTVPIFKS